MYIIYQFSFDRHPCARVSRNFAQNAGERFRAKSFVDTNMYTTCRVRKTITLLPPYPPSSLRRASATPNLRKTCFSESIMAASGEPKINT